MFSKERYTLSKINGEITLTIIASVLVLACENFGSYNFLTSLDLQSDVLELSSCLAVWYGKVASIAAHCKSLLFLSLALKNILCLMRSFITCIPHQT
jgi:hypothetical protein